MNDIRFLLDENLDPRLIDAVLRFDSAIDILRVGDTTAPPLGTSDPVILRYAAGEKRLLVTANRRSMPQHIVDHFAAGGEHWGIIWIKRDTLMRKIVEHLYLIWATSDAVEWRNRVDWIPF